MTALFRKRYQPASFLLLLGVVALLSVACQSRSVEAPIATADNPSADCRTVEHAMGKTEVCGQPQRVAVLNPHTLDIVLSLGAQPFAYAESAVLNLQTFDQPAEQIPHLGRYVTTQPINVGDRKSPSLERLAQIQPDLILSEDWLVEGQYDLLSQIAPTLLFSDIGPDGKQHWRYDIEGIAKALGRESQAEELLARYPEQIAAVREQLAPVVAAYPKVLVISSDNLTSTIYHPKESTTVYLLEEMGFEIVEPENSSLPGNDPQISMEVLPQVEADLIFVMVWSDDDLYDPQEKVKQQWAENALLKQMPASEDGRVFFVDYYLWGSATRGPITDQLILEKLPQMLLPLVNEDK